jgi:hypothetical protein
MILEYDPATKALVDRLQPQWTEIRAATRRFSNDKDASFMTEAVLFIGSRNLLCCMTAKDFGDDMWEYFPIYLKEVDEKNYAPDEWVTLARAGGASDFDRKLQWLFENPSIAVTEGVEAFRDGMSEDAKEYTFRFYNGLEISNPQGRGRLRITASTEPNFIVTLNFTF